MTAAQAWAREWTERDARTPVAPPALLVLHRTWHETVACPLCGDLCRLAGLKRPGGYRLIELDGRAHTDFCLPLQDRRDRVAPRYHPRNPHQPAARRSA